MSDVTKKLTQPMDLKKILDRQYELLEKSSQLCSISIQDQGFSTKIRSSVAALLLKRDDRFVRMVFDKHKSLLSSGSKDVREAILNANLPSALKDMGIEFDNSETLLSIFDIDLDGEVDFEEFKLVLRKPNNIEQWILSYPFSQLVACGFAPFENEENPFTSISQCTDRDLRQICSSLADGLHELLRKAVSELKQAREKMDESNQTFKTGSDSKFLSTMSCGGVSSFFGGLGNRVGVPNPNFMQAMKIEHFSETSFETVNYGLITCPREELRVVLECDRSKENVHRKIPEYRELLRQEEAQEAFLSDAELEARQAARLTEPEVVAIILYTGPMYQLYNTVLRMWPADLLASLRGQRFPTTIHCLVSGVTKISRATRIPDGLYLYRGIGGLRLPDRFYKREAGRRGFVEWGFMSTTSNKSVAIQYTGVAHGRALPTVLRIAPAAVDHGADISAFSQYPGEREYLWNPCSLVEPWGEPEVEATPEGLVTVLPVRVNMNLRTQTVEEIVAQKKESHLAAFRFQLEELRRELAMLAGSEEARRRLARDLSRATGLGLGQFVETIVGQYLGMYLTHSRLSPEDYLGDEHYRGLNAQMLDARTMAISKLRLWLEDPSQHLGMLHGLHLREAHRTRAMFLERRVAALMSKAGEGSGGEELQEEAAKLCRIKCLMDATVDERNSLGEVRIVRAAAEGADLRTFRLLIAAGADVNSEDRNGRTVVQWAALGGSVETVRELIGLKAYVGVDPRDGWAAMMSASMRGQTAVVQLLHQHAPGGEAGQLEVVQARYRGEWTALWFAAMGGHVGTIRTLVGLRGDPNAACSNGFSPLMAAAAGGHVEAIRTLVDEKAEVGAAMGNGMNSVALAAMNGHAEAIRCLAGYKADVAARGSRFPPAFIAGLWGHSAALEELASLGVDVDEPLGNGLTPRHLAQRHADARAEECPTAGESGDMGGGDLAGLSLMETGLSHKQLEVATVLQETVDRERRRAPALGMVSLMAAAQAEAERADGEGRALAPLLRGILIRMELMEAVMDAAQASLVVSTAPS